METIDEQSKSEMSLSSSSPSPENLRICLVGNVVKDDATVEAAQTFGVPVITSETGLELINDYDWRTHFILGEFEGPVYDAIHKSKQCILGPPALRQAAEMKDGLNHNARPIFNYSMRGVVTCFTGIRKKDELTKLVNLIHSMGGCIRRDMNSKITHLISSHSGGDKYKYAKTFRLTVVRPIWVYAAWEQRDDTHFKATTEEFTNDHKLKAFEGQKICFMGFPADEHQHMVDVLKSNGGVPTVSDDPECSHLVRPNSGGYYPETLNNKNEIADTNNFPKLQNPQTPSKCINPLPECGTEMEVDAEGDATKETVFNVENDNDDTDDDDDDVGSVHFDERLVVDYERSFIHNADEDDFLNDLIPLVDDVFDKISPIEVNSNVSTPKSSKSFSLFPNKAAMAYQSPIYINNDTNNDMPTTANISPMSKNDNNATKSINLPFVNAQTSSPMDAIHNNELGDPDLDLDDKAESELKRKRESLDSISLMSVESFALPTSTKKPKLLRTGSITRTIKRSMSFVAVRTPIAKMLRPRRSSVALDSTPHGNDATDNDLFDHNAESVNNSICSMASIETTFNESICKPVKEKFRSLRNRITRSSSRREKYVLNINQHELEGDYTTDDIDCKLEKDEFKTPKAPSKMANTCLSAPRPTTRSLSAILSTSSTTASTSKLCSKSHKNSPSSSTFLQKINTSSNLPADCNKMVSNGCSTLFPNTNPIAVLPQSNQTLEKSNHPSPHPHHHQQLYNEQPQQLANNSIQDMDSGCPKLTTTVVQANVTSDELTSRASDKSGQMQTVVDEHTTLVKPEPKNHRTHILKSDWFWYTIQNGFADEMDYLYEDYLDSIANTPNTERRDSLPISFNKRKRKRFSQRIQLEGTPLGSTKRRSSVSDAGLLSASGSFFDCTTSPDKLENAKLLTETETSTCEQTPNKKASMRFNHFMDFFSTELNYVGILDTIVNLFKNPLEEIAECSDALLKKSEIRDIFGDFIPIHEVHKSMLECLRSLHSKWSEECLIGDIILQHRDDLIKAYPPYVNFFERMKKTLIQCDTQNPRFHAFLKINQTKPECGRHTLQDLMIRPVQRLPSISLLLNDILKHTNKSNPDYMRIEEALKAIKGVMMHINEDKRKTELRRAIFDIFNDIEGCPAHLVSSNRSFISRCEVTELTDNLSGRGDNLMMYLFSDTIEVCKKRSRGFNTAKSPSSAKSYKHITLISLNAIRFVIDITDSPRAFALLCRQDKDELHSFTISDEEINKLVYLKTLCKQIAENACRTDTDKALLYRTSQELEVDISDVNLSTLSKAFKLAARTRLKVGRAFSFNKTPSKLKRAVSTMMTSPFGSTNSLTPASQLAQMRLASCTNIHEVGDDESSDLHSSSPSTHSEVLIPPLSVQPTRRNVSSISSVGRI